MDWKKAKNIFIIMFLIINILLSYRLIMNNRNQYKYTDQQELQKVIQYLNKKNVQVLAEVPERVYILPSIRVKYHEYDPVTMENLFFGSGSFEKKDMDKGFTLSDDHIEVKVDHGFYLTYADKAIKVEQADVDADKCLNNAYSFVDKLKLNTTGRYVKAKEVHKGYVRLVFGQKYDEVPVENSKIEVIATEQGIAQANINWFEWIKPDKDYNIITPVMAMLKAFETSGEKQNTAVIKEIRQGYYFNPDTIGGTETASPYEGTVSPMWVVVTDKAEIYVNAYTEKVEN